MIYIGNGYNAAVEREKNAIGSRIAAARKNRGWNLGVLTEALKKYGIHLTRSAINKWETGETVPNAYQFLAVCIALDLDHDLTTYMRNYTPELNDEGLRMLAKYKHDLICSGNYRPEGGGNEKKACTRTA